MKKIFFLLVFSAFHVQVSGQMAYSVQLHGLTYLSSSQPFSIGRHGTDSLFQNMPAFYRMSKTYQITWNEEIAGNPLTLMLYQNNTYRSTLQEDININYYEGKVPRKAGGGKYLQPGGPYHFVLYDQVTREMKASDSFELKRRIPLAVQIPVYVGIAGGIGVLVSNLFKKEESQPEVPLLPDPPSPHN